MPKGDPSFRLRMACSNKFGVLQMQRRECRTFLLEVRCHVWCKRNRKAPPVSFRSRLPFAEASLTDALDWAGTPWITRKCPLHHLRQNTLR